MSTEENKAQDRRFTEEVWNRGNLAVLDELFSVDFNGHDPTIPPGRELEQERISHAYALKQLEKLMQIGARVS